MTHSLTRAGMVLGACLAPALPVADALAASHREAPVTAIDRTADITDWYAFVSPDAPDTVTMILAVDPLLEPSNGPNYFPFDDNLLYEFNVDNDQDAREDISFRIRFKTEIRLPDVPVGFVGAGNGIAAPGNSPPPIAPGTPLIPPAITALDGPGSEGLEPAPDLQGHSGPRPQGDPAQQPTSPCSRCRAMSGRAPCRTTRT